MDWEDRTILEGMQGMMDMQIETLVTELAPPTLTEGFNAPFHVERLCHAFGDNLGGNAPTPSWFDGYDIVAAVRQGSRGTPHMPTAVLLRRQDDGALRLVASDHVSVRGEPGCDFMLAARHRAIAHDAILSACDEGGVPKAAKHAISIIDAATTSTGVGPVDILAVRRDRDDLKDVRTAREIVPTIGELDALLNRISRSDRRNAARSHLRALAGELGLDLD